MNSTDQEFCEKLIQRKEAGFSVREYYKTSIKGNPKSLIILLIAPGYGIYLTCIPDEFSRIVGTALIALFVGRITRDIAWVQKLKKGWPFTASIIDWAKVNGIAKGEITVNLTK